MLRKVYEQIMKIIENKFAKSTEMKEELAGFIEWLNLHVPSLGVNPATFDNYISRYIKETQPKARPITKELILETVCNYFELSEELLKSKSRETDICKPRQIAMYLLKKYTKLTSAKIGFIFLRDHSTLYFALKTVANLMETDKEYNQQIEEIKELINATNI